MSIVDPRIAAYVAEVSQPGIPYVSTSQDRLMELYVIHGEQVINDLLTLYWSEQRSNQPNERTHE
jgi:hypothetical protein